MTSGFTVLPHCPSCPVHTKENNSPPFTVPLNIVSLLKRLHFSVFVLQSLKVAASAGRFEESKVKLTQSGFTYLMKNQLRVLMIV